MTDATEASWLRPHWTPGAGRAVLLYFVFGDFDAGLRPPAGAGLQVRRYRHDALREWSGYPLAGQLGALLRHDEPRAFEQAARAGEVVRLSADLPDPANLDYLLDGLRAIDALLDAGGVAVIDPQALGLFDADAWRRRRADARAPRTHVLILRNDDGAGGAWVHSRGMRKFARPDVSIRGVPEADVPRAGALCERLVELQALGMRFDDGKAIEIEGFDAPLHVAPGGSPDDPRFNNTHLELGWPQPSR